MKLVIQRVKHAKVEVDNQIAAEIEQGLLVLAGVSKNEDKLSVKWLANKILNLRIFDDDAGKMNLSIKDIEGEILLVSQFTLYGNCSRGRRPGFDEAAHPEVADGIIENLFSELFNSGIDVKKGIFGANMQLTLLNDGPVTFILEK
jgi:D-aminoacyl-tRNA deacylase